MKAHGIVLAAGRSSRAGTRKALALVDGQTMLSRALATLSEGGCRLFTVVAGDDAKGLLPQTSWARVVHNDRVDEGMLRSLQLGLADAQAQGAEVAVVALIDHPHVQPTTVRALLGRPAARAGVAARADPVAEHLAGSVAAVVFPTYRGERGHPFALNARGFEMVLGAEASTKTSEVLQLLSALELPVDDAAVVEDLDTAEDLARAGVQPV